MPFSPRDLSKARKVAEAAEFTVKVPWSSVLLVASRRHFCSSSPRPPNAVFGCLVPELHRRRTGDRHTLQTRVHVALRRLPLPSWTLLPYISGETTIVSE